ncbi:DUF389 domain-containing protein [Halostagnicola sp. A-GB9-2]|uniref:DUF389 domain-containing protein n=1 Tax=Halostagnicola sp. A-GB9-2 TaxID=3048066 RepID=UPI0024C03CFB|nr:DUF389 domain-containing protein [Halostagnicola sp. A-GB9-2]MDJ1432097.1 DUF389 domain-containing protein [Halostagnicola sp. A-GB9-2]
MRLVHVTVPEERRDAARAALKDEQFTFTVVPIVDDDLVMFEIPVPSNAVGDVLDVLEAVEVDVTDYTVVASGETAMTETSETLEREYAGDYKPMTAVELRTKARDLSRDTASYAALMILSALIATAGLLISSPAIVVGSMVIAPIIGPALTASVGTVTGDRKMIADSFWMQLYGLGLAIIAAAALAAGFRFGGFVPTTIDLPALDLFGVRLAPNMLSLVVAVAAGTSAGIGLTTKGPTSIIGVMIAAALIPTAAATGISIAWIEPELAIGTAVLLLATLVVINLAVFAVLLLLGYASRGRTSPGGELDRSLIATSVLAIIVIALTLSVGFATVQQVGVDREVATSVEETLEDPGYEDLTAVSVQTQYADMSPYTGPRSVTVEVSEEGDADTAAFAADVAETIEERTGEAIDVRVEPVEYESASAGEQ